MPTYEYRCEKGHTFEVMQRMTDEPLTVCEEHGTPVQRVFHPVAVHFKGSGFYNTDYGKNKKSAAASEGKSESGNSDSKKETKKDSSSSSSSTSSGSSSSDSGSSGSGSSGSSSSGSD